MAAHEYVAGYNQVLRWQGTHLEGLAVFEALRITC